MVGCDWPPPVDEVVISEPVKVEEAMFWLPDELVPPLLNPNGPPAAESEGAPGNVSVTLTEPAGVPVCVWPGNSALRSAHAPHCRRSSQGWSLRRCRT